jgi:hypothetical protein
VAIAATATNAAAVRCDTKRAVPELVLMPAEASSGIFLWVARGLSRTKGETPGYARRKPEASRIEHLDSVDDRRMGDRSPAVSRSLS